MSAAAARPRVGGAFAVSAALHAVVLGALAVSRAPAPRPAAPVYRVDLVAAPPGPARLGELAPGAAGTAPNTAPNTSPNTAPARPPTPVPLPRPAPSRAVPTAPPTPPRPAAPTATVAPPKPAPPKAAPPRPAPARPAPPPRVAAATPSKPSVANAPPASPSTTAATRGNAPRTAASSKAAGTPAPTRTGAGGPPTARPAASAPAGGTGRDPTTVRTPGLNFPYPGYLANIARQVDIRFDPGARRLEADVAFLIHRDGSVTDIRVVRSSGSYAFDLEAQGAVEAAGTARAFGALPGGFRDDVLPVTFSFDPRGLR